MTEGLTKRAQVAANLKSLKARQKRMIRIAEKGVQKFL